MNIWKLHPTDTSSPSWNYSAYHEDLFVRAESELNARDVAERAFIQMAPAKTGEKIPVGSPWKQESLVSAAVVKNSGYPEQGDEEILGPPEALGHLDS